MRRPTLRLGTTKAFVEFVLAFLLALGFQLIHKASCSAGGSLTLLPLCPYPLRWSHHLAYPVHHVSRGVHDPPHFVLRYRQMRPEVARDALLATHGGLSLERCAVLYHISPMALYRMVCALGHQSLVCVLTRCGLPLPVYVLADEKHGYQVLHREGVSPHHCLRPRDLAPGLYDGGQCRGPDPVLWGVSTHHLPSRSRRTESKGFTDGFTAPTTVCGYVSDTPGTCWRHALKPGSNWRRLRRRSARHPHAVPATLLFWARQRRGLRVCALGQQLRRFVDRVTTTAGTVNGARVRRWFQDKKAAGTPSLKTHGCQ